VLNKEYQAFLQRVEERKNKVIDAYGAESPIKFFAAIAESFFEQPQLMHERLPALHQQLQQFYQLDPAQW